MSVKNESFTSDCEAQMIDVSMLSMQRERISKSFQLPPEILDAVESAPEAVNERLWVIASASLLMFLAADRETRLQYIDLVNAANVRQDFTKLVTNQGQTMKRAAKRKEGA